jgi:hypothetical protein
MNYAPYVGWVTRYPPVDLVKSDRLLVKRILIDNHFSGLTISMKIRITNVLIYNEISH